MQSAIDLKSTSMDMSGSVTAGHLPHAALELRRTEATTSASTLSSSDGALP
jgi:hypothetical protein